MSEGQVNLAMVWSSVLENLDNSSLPPQQRAWLPQTRPLGLIEDTALLAARWTLNHQPKGAKIKWVASQPRKVGKRDAWLIAYEVRYTVKGKRRTSMAAVLLTEVPKRKPALLFVAIPDSQKRYWRDINTIVSTVKAV